ncbi:restriction endonuclease subunit S [Photobacterium piscicola]|uniref:restriction endonuclease subunit S n=1 Tax=Photobacterium piscicola TaxID=1378299 RepID=UPI003735394B
MTAMSETKKAALSGKYVAYSEYKDSGVEWLGEIPSHWKVKKIKHFGRVLGGFAFKSGDFIKQGYPVIKITNVSHLVMSFNEQAYLPEKFAHENAEYIAQPNSLIFAMTRPIIAGGIKVAKMPKLEKMPLINQRVGFLKIEDENITDYILFSSLSNSFIAQFENNMTITNQPNISSEGIESVSLPFPPKNELEKIVTFLDHETAKIDTLIEKQQQLIELLKEKRQAVVSHAVTKGLNPDAPMKDSGVEWLGEVPEHWDVVKCAYLGQLFGSETIKEDLIQAEGDIPFIKVSSLSLDSFDLDEKNHFVSSSKVSINKCNSNYVVFPKRGAAIFTNKVNIVREKSFIDPNLMGWKLNNNIKAEYVAYLLKLRGLGDIADVSTVPQINNKHIEPMKFPLPPLGEQEDILNSLLKKNEQFNQLIKESYSATNLLKERRTALISAAVTGKIDVRNWVAPTTSSDTNEAVQKVTA